jgi:hypothetical protein
MGKEKGQAIRTLIAFALLFQPVFNALLLA